jgi:hypothetical protein
MAVVGQTAYMPTLPIYAVVYQIFSLEELWNIMFTSRDFLRVEYNVLSKNVTRDVGQSEKTLSEVI